MKYLYFIVLLFVSIILTGCIFIDDNCHYETRCNYVTHCETVCDSWGNNCAPANCYDAVDHCWDEYICSDY